MSLQLGGAARVNWELITMKNTSTRYDVCEDCLDIVDLNDDLVTVAMFVDVLLLLLSDFTVDRLPDALLLGAALIHVLRALVRVLVTLLDVLVFDVFHQVLLSVVLPVYWALRNCIVSE